MNKLQREIKILSKVFDLLIGIILFWFKVFLIAFFGGVFFLSSYPDKFLVGLIIVGCALSLVYVVSGMEIQSKELEKLKRLRVK